MYLGLYTNEAKMQYLYEMGFDSYEVEYSIRNWDVFEEEYGDED